MQLERKRSQLLIYRDLSTRKCVSNFREVEKVKKPFETLYGVHTTFLIDVAANVITPTTYFIRWEIIRNVARYGGIFLITNKNNDSFLVMWIVLTVDLGCSFFSGLPFH